MLAVRILTAVALLAVLLPILFLAPPIWTSIIAGGFFAFAGREWARLLGYGPRAAIVWAIAVAIACWLVAYIGKHAGYTLATMATMFWCVIAPWWLKTGLPDFQGRTRLPLAMLSVLVLAATWWGLDAALSRGPLFLLSILGIVWVSDVAAYFAGRALGRHKLAPRISPGKTWEGVAGAVATTLALAWLSSRLIPISLPNFSTVMFESFPAAIGFLAIAVLVMLGIVG
ncbi:MAG TPA: phosphatidate cytidylyltransferase, partial [Burkholderiaceae bacterium]|nr:phosphatidate cytidylyltransferase [Burkholderiaceae bacterium]